MSRSARWLLWLPALALAGCATGLKPPAGTGPGAAPGVPQSAPGKGGYYKDDGPGSDVPAGLASLPDAVPRDEPLRRAANRPYQVFGREYVPFAELRPYRERGVASWYGRRFNGQPTASGEIYDMYSMSAAHPLLPIPSYARVTNLANGRSVVVRINDRGPFFGERLIDLSYAAAFKLGFADKGSAQVEVESILPGSEPTVIAQAEARAGPEVTPGVTPAVTPVSAPVVTQALAATPVAIAQSTAQTNAQPVAAIPPGVYLQLGAFASRDNAESFRVRVYRELGWLTDGIQIVNSGGLYKVQLGPYRSRADAKPVALRISSELDFTPMMLVH